MPSGFPTKSREKICGQCKSTFETTAPNVKFCQTSCKEKARYIRSDGKRKLAVSEHYHANRDKINAKRRETYSVDPVRFNETSRKSYLKHREKRILNATQYQKDNKEQTNLKNRKRALRKRTTVYRITQDDLRRLVLRHGGRCFYCSCELLPQGRSNPRSLQYDHLIPIARGGVDSIGNLVPACRTCNLRKNDRLSYAYKITLRREQ